MMRGIGAAITLGLLDMRGDIRRFGLLVVCLAVGTALIAGVSSIGAGIERAVERDAAVILGGDVLFPRGHGRIDIAGADQFDMQNSLARLAALPDNVTVYPGHGAPTTIGAEKDWLPTK